MAKLSHRDLGGAGRPPLVILHGMLGSSRNWQTAGRDLAAHFHVRALDARNHGQSPHAGEMTYPLMVADVLRWMDAQGLEKAVLMGHSMGGKTAMLLACQHPERLAGLVVVDIAPKDYHWPARRGELAAMSAIDLATLPTRADAERQLEASVPDWALRKFFLTNLERDAEGRWRWAVNLPVLAATFPALGITPLQENDRYDGPCLFVLGGRSRFVRSGDHDRIRHHFPGARIETIADAGHNPHMETRAALVGLVSAAREWNVT